MFEQKRAALKKVMKSNDPRVKASGKGLAFDVATGINRISGATDLAEYAGSKIAKRMVAPSAKKYVSDNVSGKKAAISGAKTLGTIGSLAAGGVLGRMSANVAKRRALKNTLRVARGTNTGSKMYAS